MTVREMADELGCTVRHARHLVLSRRVESRVVTEGARSRYEVDPRSIREYDRTKSAVGFPRGARRYGPRGKMMPIQPIVTRGEP